MKEDNRSGSDEGVGVSSPTLKSGSIVILAADSALAAVRSHFTEYMKEDYWGTVKYQRAALEAALASLLDSQ